MEQRKEVEKKMDSMDRISKLPELILHHILCFLSQKEAVQTCVFSKSWRLLGITRPKMEFHQNILFPKEKRKFVSLFDKTLQRYHDQNLPIHEFVLSFFPGENPQWVAILENWILLLLQKGVKKIDFSFGSVSRSSSLPSLVFQAQSLEELYLRKCRLFNNNSIDNVLLKHLRKLSLDTVFISQETLKKIYSSCPLLEYVVLKRCKGLKTINVKEVHNLKHFKCRLISETRTTSNIVEFNSQTLETIRITNYPNWYQHHHKEHFHRLKTLCLKRVWLRTGSFDIFSRNFPCLEELQLSGCHGFEQVRLSSPSIKRLTIDMGSKDSIKAFIIDAPNILYLHFSGFSPPFLSFSKFPTTSKNEQLMSRIDLVCQVESDDAFSTWFLRLNVLLKALTRSRISLNFRWFCYPPMSQITFCDSYEPAQVENLIANEYFLSSDFRVSSNRLFRTCRPRYITGMYLYVDAKSEQRRKQNNRVNSLCNIFLEEIRGETMSQCCFWIHDLKQASMESFDEKAKEWCLVQGTSWSECALSNNQPGIKIRIRLIWRES